MGVNMNAFEELMNERWISRRKDRDLFYQVKDRLSDIRSFFVEKLGYRIINNNHVVKVEKMPGEALPWMGIQEFKQEVEYALFCVLLMFLEDKEVEEQFVLSQLTEYISAHYPGEPIEWTVYANRQMLIRVMKFCIKSDLFVVDDGSLDTFATNLEAEALYENTGLSKYFTRSFTKDISGYKSIAEFFHSDWFDMNEERGVVRRQRVYRKLLLSLGMYREKEQDEDYNYIKYYRSVIENDLEQLMDCSLQIHKSSAYLILGENGTLGAQFPQNNSLSDAILLFHKEVSDRVSQNILQPEVNERIILPRLRVREIIQIARDKFGSGLAKSYREMSDQEYCDCMEAQLRSLGIIRMDEVTQEVTIMPIAGKIIGAYPDRYMELKEGETKDAIQ